MNLNEFLNQHQHLHLLSDSRKAGVDSLFFAIRGTHADGHKFLKDVYEKGCRHFVVEDDSDLKNYKNIQVLVVPNSKSAWAKAWILKTNRPDMSMFIVGVTGTNGKTSTTMMIEHIFNSMNLSCGIMGTIDHHLGTGSEKKIWPTGLTTPGAEILFPRLKEMKDLGAGAVALEISSHALDQKRAEGLNLDAAVFTNLTEDHLDYHPDLKHYFESKVLLFEDLLKESLKTHKVSVLNYTDSWIESYLPSFGCVELLYEVSSLENLEKDVKLNRLIERLKDTSKNIKINLVCIKQHSLNGLKINLLFDFKKNKTPFVLSFDLSLLGHFQAINWSQAVLVCKSQLEFLKRQHGTEFSNSKETLENNLILSLEPHQALVMQKAATTFKGVPGRLQKVFNSLNKAVFVDYAHTPDALERTLKSLREVCRGQLIVIFGCGGDRDKAKRPLMASVAAKEADIQIITNDNPRTEEPEKILEDILEGFKTTDAKPLVELDRKKAIELGLNLLQKPEDVLLIAGKGHENYQILNNKTIDFSDYETAEFFLQRNI